jgi:fucose 4-O-acetylase-like acetyltransferase
VSRQKFVAVEILAAFGYFYALLWTTRAAILVAAGIAVAMIFLTSSELAYSVAFVMHKYRYRGTRRSETDAPESDA